jgi:hypothetical protein
MYRKKLLDFPKYHNVSVQEEETSNKFKMGLRDSVQPGAGNPSYLGG